MEKKCTYEFFTEKIYSTKNEVQSKVEKIFELKRTLII